MDEKKREKNERKQKCSLGFVTQKIMASSTTDVVMGVEADLA